MHDTKFDGLIDSYPSFSNDIKSGSDNDNKCALLIKPYHFETLLWIIQFLSFQCYLRKRKMESDMSVETILNDNFKTSSLFAYDICIETSMTTNDCLCYHIYSLLVL